MVPYHGGALLPIEQRYSSAIFLRFHRFTKSALSLHQGAELFAFVRLIGEDAAAYVFRWDEATREAWGHVKANEKVQLKSIAYWDANQQALDAETGIAVLEAMLAGGFRRGRPPMVVIMALQELRERGEIAKDMAERFGHKVTVFQLWSWMTPPRARLSPRRLRDRGLVAA